MTMCHGIRSDLLRSAAEFNKMPHGIHIIFAAKHCGSYLWPFLITVESCNLAKSAIRECSEQQTMGEVNFG